MNNIPFQDSKDIRKNLRWLPIAFFIAIVIIELWAIFNINNGHFIYTLDDAYIHLAMAENIAQGHYGVNLNEFSAASSSIIWPFILSLFKGNAYIPLIINIITASITIIFFFLIISTILNSTNRQYTVLMSLIILWLILATNLIGLIFTGLEHSAQILLSVMVAGGLIYEAETGKTTWWFILALLIGPLIRYENLALSLPALVYLAWQKHYLAAGITGFITLILLGGFSLFLWTMGLGILPSSIVAKSSLIREGLSFIPANFSTENFFGSQLPLFLITLFLLGYLIYSRQGKDRLLASWAMVVVILHLFFGRFGFFFRYEVYVLAAVLPIILYLHRNLITTPVNQMMSKQKIQFYLLGIYGIIICLLYLAPLLLTPIASNNIFEQQYQMHRFATEFYSAPVAVNDLGWVSYQNDNYVLDLAGLASEEVLHFLNTEDVNWINVLAEKHKAKLIISHRGINSIPTNWLLVGELYLSRPNISAVSATTKFYVYDKATFEQVSNLLFDFGKTLPKEVTLIIKEN